MYFTLEFIQFYLFMINFRTNINVNLHFIYNNLNTFLNIN